MITGVDTTFLVELEIAESAGHDRAMAYLATDVMGAGGQLALSPQVLLEFVHVVTDPRRFREPLTVESALDKADHWWRAAEVRQVEAGPAAVTLFLHWMHRHRLGRKRLLDTMLAATYVAAGVRSILSTNARDYRVFEELQVVNPVDA